MPLTAGLRNRQLKPKERVKDGPRRLSLNLSDAVYDEVAALAKERRSSMTEVVRLALGLVKVAINESRKGHKLIVTTQDGDALKELVLPG